MSSKHLCLRLNANFNFTKTNNTVSMLNNNSLFVTGILANNNVGNLLIGFLQNPLLGTNTILLPSFSESLVDLYSQMNKKIHSHGPAGKWLSMRDLFVDSVQ